MGWRARLSLLPYAKAMWLFHPGRSAAEVTSRAFAGDGFTSRRISTCDRIQESRYDTYVVGGVAQSDCGPHAAGSNGSTGQGAERDHSGQGDVRSGPSHRGCEHPHHGNECVRRYERRGQLYHHHPRRARAWPKCGAACALHRSEAGRKADCAASRRDHAELRAAG